MGTPAFAALSCGSLNNPLVRHSLWPGPDRHCPKLVRHGWYAPGACIRARSRDKLSTMVYPVIMGINLGTCVTTAMVCSIGSSKDAKRTGVVHIALQYHRHDPLYASHDCSAEAVGAFSAELWDAQCATAANIANFQTIFNLITAIVLLPFTGSAGEAVHRSFVKDDKHVATADDHRRHSIRWMKSCIVAPCYGRVPNRHRRLRRRYGQAGQGEFRRQWLHGSLRTSDDADRCQRDRRGRGLHRRIHGHRRPLPHWTVQGRRGRRSRTTGQLDMLMQTVPRLRANRRLRHAHLVELSQRLGRGQRRPSPTWRKARN